MARRLALGPRLCYCQGPRQLIDWTTSLTYRIMWRIQPADTLAWPREVGVGMGVRRHAGRPTGPTGQNRPNSTNGRLAQFGGSAHPNFTLRRVGRVLGRPSQYCSAISASRSCLHWATLATHCGRPAIRSERLR